VISKNRIIGAVEIGTHKVSALVGEFAGGRRLNIIGLGACSSQGVIKGSIVDMKAASDCTHAAIEAAERKAGARIDGVYLAQTGAHLDGFYHEGSVNVSSADNLVDRDDIATVCELARGKELPAERAVVQYLRRPFRLDGQPVPNPENLTGRKLEVGYWTVHGDKRKISDGIHLINGFNLKVDEIILASLASGTMVTTHEERRNGVLVLDIGRGTTDYVLYRDGYPWVTGNIPVGGDHLTNDLALGLRLTSGQAEAMKLRHGSAVITAKDHTEKVWLNGDFAIGDRHFPRQAVEQITAVRIVELFEVVKKKLGPAFVPEMLGAGVVLTGGTSKLMAIDEAATAVFGVSARRGELPTNLADELRDPQYSTVLGLLFYGLNQINDRAPAAYQRRSGGLMERFTRMFANA
jgi:cell division protein FtsA